MISTIGSLEKPDWHNFLSNRWILLKFYQEILWTLFYTGPASLAAHIKKAFKKSCTKVAVDFVSPENIRECLRLTEEFRQLPVNHRAREDKLEIKKMIIYAIDKAIIDLQELTKSQHWALPRLLPTGQTTQIQQQHIFYSLLDFHMHIHCLHPVVMAALKAIGSNFLEVAFEIK